MKKKDNSAENGNKFSQMMPFQINETFLWTTIIIVFCLWAWATMRPVVSSSISKSWVAAPFNFVIDISSSIGSAIKGRTSARNVEFIPVKIKPNDVAAVVEKSVQEKRPMLLHIFVADPDCKDCSSLLKNVNKSSKPFSGEELVVMNIAVGAEEKIFQWQKEHYKNPKNTIYFMADTQANNIAWLGMKGYIANAKISLSKLPYKGLYTPKKGLRPLPEATLNDADAFAEFVTSE